MSNLEGLQILEAFNIAAKKAGLDYLIIGGFAASFWGKPRFTADIDYVVELSSLDLVQKVLEELKYKLDFLHPKKGFAHFTPIEGSGFRMDFMLVDQNTWAKLKAGMKEAGFGSKLLYPIVDHLHLISMKLHAAKQIDREDFYKDLNDIVEIMLAQDMSFENLEKEGIIEKHGTEKTIKLLKDLYQSRIERRQS